MIKFLKFALMSLGVVFVGLVLTAAALWLPAIERQQTFESDGCCVDITHAGGLIGGVAYTNSLEALETSRAAGRRIFEVDLLETSDGHVVLAHDWDQFAGRAPDLATFRTSRPGLTLLTWPEYLSWVADCSDCKTVTDPKMDFAAFWALFQDTVSDTRAHAQFVVQTYSIDQLLWLADNHPDQPSILTIYKLSELTDADLRRVGSVEPMIALTMPIDRVIALSRRASRLSGKPVYTHGPPGVMTSIAVLKAARILGVTGFYLDV